MQIGRHAWDDDDPKSIGRGTFQCASGCQVMEDIAIMFNAGFGLVDMGQHCGGCDHLSTVSPFSNKLRSFDFKYNQREKGERVNQTARKEKKKFLKMEGRFCK